MTAAELVQFGVNLSMALKVFSVALERGKTPIWTVVMEPGLLVRSLVAMYVVMPLVAVAIAYAFDLNRALEVGLILLALSPVPPILPKKEIETGGSRRYVLGLLAVASLASIVVVPGGIALIGWFFGEHAIIPLDVTAKVVAVSVFLPLIAGLATARLAPESSGRIARPLSIAATVLLLALFLPILLAARHAIFAQFGNFTILAIVAFSLVGIGVGHLLGGPVEGNRSALALATATRHPGVALAIMHAIAPQNQEVGPVILLYLLVSAIASLPYVGWQKRRVAHA
jgi:BASS family bile acid:Na+ symporter